MMTIIIIIILILIRWKLTIKTLTTISPIIARTTNYTYNAESNIQNQFKIQNQNSTLIRWSIRKINYSKYKFANRNHLLKFLVWMILHTLTNYSPFPFFMLKFHYIKQKHRSVPSCRMFGVVLPDLRKHLFFN